jgi:nitrite reductase/ring-hydroxylating ferredoxin subunit
MAHIEISLYSAGVLVILFSIYAFPLFQLVSTRITALYTSTTQWRAGLKKTVSLPSTPASDGQPSIEVCQESLFGPDWWSDDKIFALERRALFSTSWIYATHRSRFSKAGDYLTLSVAGFSYFLILGKDHILRGFHNVCRHRAYEVTRKECGSSTVLGCRYHGWSYDTTGQLTKAPEFDNVEGFDKSKNSLFEIHVRVDDNGMVFVNLDAGEVEGIEDTEMKEITKKRDAKWITSKKICEWRQEGTFNWKLAGTCKAIFYFQFILPFDIMCFTDFSSHQQPAQQQLGSQ